MINKNEYVSCTNCINLEDNLECINNCNSIEEKSCNGCKCNGCECENLEDSAAIEFKQNYIGIEEMG